MDHIKTMAPIVREADRQEVWASSQKEPEEALVESFNLATNAWTMKHGDDIVCIFGITPISLLDDQMIVWLLSSVHVEKYSMPFLRACRSFLKVLMAKYNSMENFVDARYKESVRWLKWLGFDVSEPEPFGKLNMPFHRVKMEV